MPTARALEAGRAVIRLALDQADVERQLAKLKNLSVRLTGRLGRVGTFGIGGMGLGGVGGLRALFTTSAGAAALAWPIKLAANLEEAKAEFTALTGSADQATKMIDELQAFSKYSIVPVEELQQAAAGLLGYGVSAQNVLPVLKSLTVLSRGSADRLQRLALAYGQVAGKQRLYAQEVRQFVEAGFNPLSEIARRTGETIKEVQARMESGGISAGETAAAIQAAVAPGGRFFGLLEMMSKTAIGQFRRFKTELVLAFRPLGQSVLPMFTEFFQAINGAMAPIGEFIKQNTRVFQVILLAGLAAASAATAFVTFGLGFSIMSVAARGVGNAIAIATTAFSLLLNPLVLAGAAVAALVAYFVHATGMGAQLAAAFGQWFGELATIAGDMIRGISDALAAGEIGLAAEVMWAGLKAMWQKGTDEIEGFWSSMTNDLLWGLTDISFQIEGAWANMLANLKAAWQEFKGWWQDAWDVIVHNLAGIGETDRVKQQLQEDLANRVGAREVDRRAALAQIETERAAANDRIQRLRDEALRNADAEMRANAAERAAEVKAAEDELARLKAEAAKKRKENEKKVKFDPGKFAFDGIGGAGLSAARSPAIFDAQFSRQQFGGTDETTKDLLRKIEANTRKKWGVPVG